MDEHPQLLVLQSYLHLPRSWETASARLPNEILKYGDFEQGVLQPVMWDTEQTVTEACHNPSQHDMKQQSDPTC